MTGPDPDKPVTIEQFLQEGRLVLKDGRPFHPTEAQLRFVQEAAAKGQELLRADVVALNSLHSPTSTPTQ